MIFIIIGIAFLVMFMQFQIISIEKRIDKLERLKREIDHLYGNDQMLFDMHKLLKSAVFPETRIKE